MAEVIKVDSETVKTYKVYVKDGEVRDQPYTRVGRRYRSHTITVIKREGNVSSVKLEGPVIKKDGSDSQNWAAENFYAQREWPAWLKSIVGGLA